MAKGSLRWAASTNSRSMRKISLDIRREFDYGSCGCEASTAAKESGLFQDPLLQSLDLSTIADKARAAEVHRAPAEPGGNAGGGNTQLQAENQRLRDEVSA